MEVAFTSWEIALLDSCVYREQGGGNGKEKRSRLCTLRPNKGANDKVFFFWRSLCICVRARLGKSREREQTDRRSRSNCVWLRELKKASRFASWSQRRRAGGKDSIDEERWRRCCCCYSPFFFLFFFSRSALTRTHTRPPEAAKPSWERSNSGGLSLLLLLLLLLPFRPRLPHVTRATGARRAHRLSKALATPASTRAAFFFFLLDITWIPFFYFFSFFDALLSGERERISFVKILSPHQSSHLPRYSLNCLSTISAF